MNPDHREIRAQVGAMMARLGLFATTWIMNVSVAAMVVCILMVLAGLDRWADPVFHVAYPLGVSAMFVRIVFRLEDKAKQQKERHGTSDCSREGQ